MLLMWIRPGREGEAVFRFSASLASEFFSVAGCGRVEAGISDWGWVAAGESDAESSVGDASLSRASLTNGSRCPQEGRSIRSRKRGEKRQNKGKW